jgi:hypothetical protein
MWRQFALNDVQIRSANAASANAQKHVALRRLGDRPLFEYERPAFDGHRFVQNGGAHPAPRVPPIGADRSCADEVLLARVRLAGETKAGAKWRWLPHKLP